MICLNCGRKIKSSREPKGTLFCRCQQEYDEGIKLITFFAVVIFITIIVLAVFKLFYM